MVRRLAIAAFTVTALSSGLASALGLGEATVRSSLNQPLNAEIELVNIRDLEEREILTNLATREEFQRAGVDRVYFLSDLRFKVMVKGGKAVIRVTSAKPVREPFLNFLVEVNWPSGRLLREYAILIDPPTFSSEKPTPVQTAATQAPSRKTAPTKKTTPVRRTTQQPSQTQSTVQTAPAYQGDSYGPTAPNDTMWAIALKTRPDKSVSPQQMMLAIQDLNPDAFINGNINLLKKGQVLRVPTGEQIAARNAGDAFADVNVQNREFSQKAATRTVDATRDTTASADVDTRPPPHELRIVVDKSADEATKAEQSGTSPSGQGSDVSVTMEQLDKANRENEELKGRLEDLEGQLETLQRLVELKDDQLAALQGEIATGSLDAETPTDDQTLSGQMPVEDTDPLSGQPTQDQLQPAGSSEAKDNDAAGQLVDDVQASQVPVTSDTAGQVEPTTKPMEPQPTPEPVEPEPQPISQPEPPAQEQSMAEKIVDNFKNNIVYQIAAASGAVILVILLWMVARGRSSSRDDSYYDDMLEDEGAVITFDEEEEAGKVPGSEPAESDPIAEADVYVAYQKHDQAAQVLETALHDEPENQEYRLKLLEVLGEGRNTEKFQATYAELEAAGDPQILTRANDIKVRYADLSDEPEVSLDDLESQLLAGDSLDLDTDASSGGEDLDNFELDMDLEGQGDDLDSTIIQQSEDDADFVQKESLDLEAESSVDSDDLDIDFDLSDIDLEDDSSTAEAETDVSSELADLDFDSDLESMETETSDSLDMDFDDDLQAVGEQEYDLNTDLSDEMDEIAGIADIDLETEPEEEKEKKEEPVDELSLELDEDDFNIDLDEEALAKEEPEADLDSTIIHTPEAEESATAAKTEDLGLEADGLDFGDEAISSDIAEEFMQNIDDAMGDLESELGVLPEGEFEETTADLDFSEDLGLVDTEEKAEVSMGESVSKVDLDTTIIQPQPVPEAQPGSEFTEELEDDFDFLSDTDEAATKLDLARAYVDMGDKEGARDILEEVAEEGSNDQKQEAAELLKTLE